MLECDGSTAVNFEDVWWWICCDNMVVIEEYLNTDCNCWKYCCLVFLVLDVFMILSVGIGEMSLRVLIGYFLNIDKEKISANELPQTFSTKISMTTHRVNSDQH